MAENEALAVASKVKAYIKKSGDLKCSAAVIDVLSEKIRALCVTAIEKAKAERRRWTTPRLRRQRSSNRSLMPSP